LNKFEYIVVRFVHQGVSENKIPTVKADIKEFKISQVKGMFRGKKEAIFILGDGLLNSFIGLSMGSLGILLIFSVFTGGKLETNTYSILVTISAVFLLFSTLLTSAGIKKLYTYLTCVIEVKPKGEKKH
jgi:hypothetical protein